MTRPLAVLRPEPGNAQTAAAIVAAGGRALRLPLFRIAPLGWRAPDTTAYDALLVTSANAVRHAGPGLARLAHLPVHAVGAATADAARAAGLTVAATGRGGVDALVAAAPAEIRWLRLAGQEHMPLPAVDTLPVYVAEPLPDVDPAPLAGSVALLHSARAGVRLAALVRGVARRTIALAAISPAALAAAGGGWERGAATARPRDADLVRLALDLAD